MREEFDYDIPGEQTGECWAVSAHPNGDGTISQEAKHGRADGNDSIQSCIKIIENVINSNNMRN